RLTVSTRVSSVDWRTPGRISSITVLSTNQPARPTNRKYTRKIRIPRGISRAPRGDRRSAGSHQPQAVAQAAVGLDRFGIGGHQAQLGAQALDMAVDAALVADLGRHPQA